MSVPFPMPQSTNPPRTPLSLERGGRVPKAQLKPFRLDGIPDEEASISGRGRIGGVLTARAAVVKVPTVRGLHVLDPIASGEDMASLAAFCRAQGTPLHVEIGFGRGPFGERFCDVRRTEGRAVRYVGFEVRRKYVELADARFAALGLDDARFVLADAREVIPRAVPIGGVAALYVLFPDPWWKRRHHKRRIVSEELASLSWAHLEPGGALFFKSDVSEYASWARSLFVNWRSATGDGWRIEDGADSSLGLPSTLREKRCQELGLPTFAFVARRPGLAGTETAPCATDARQGASR